MCKLLWFIYSFKFILSNNGDDSERIMMIFIINTFSYVALLEQVRNGLNDAITNETCDKNDFAMSVSNIDDVTLM